MKASYPSSSPTRPLAPDAPLGLVVRHGRVVGPIQLPSVNTQQFIERFNDCYSVEGLRIICPPSSLPGQIAANGEGK